jgi:hypothetical protein
MKKLMTIAITLSVLGVLILSGGCASMGDGQSPSRHQGHSH